MATGNIASAWVENGHACLDLCVPGEAVLADGKTADAHYIARIPIDSGQITEDVLIAAAKAERARMLVIAAPPTSLHDGSGNPIPGGPVNLISKKGAKVAL